MKKTIYLIFSFITSMIGYTIHSSIFWSIMDFLFTPLAWIKWIFYHEITLTVINKTFNWFIN
jgi:hypothetical protein